MPLIVHTLHLHFLLHGSKGVCTCCSLCRSAMQCAAHNANVFTFVSSTPQHCLPAYQGPCALGYAVSRQIVHAVQSGIEYPVVVRFDTVNYAGVATNNFGLEEVKEVKDTRQMQVP